MPFLGCTFAGVRNRIPGIGTGAGNVERSRRHTISTVVTSASSPLEVGALTPIVEDCNAGDAGRTTTKRNRHKSVTFSTVDLITHLPTVTNSTVSSPPPAAASSHTRAAKSPDFFAQSQNSTSAPVQNGLSEPRVMGEQDAPDYLSGSPRGRRYTVAGPPITQRFSSSQAPDSKCGSYSPIDWKEDHERSRSQKRKRRHTTLAPPSDYPRHEQALGNSMYSWQPPSEYVPLRYQDSSLGSPPARSGYDRSSKFLVGGTQNRPVPQGIRRSFPLSLGIPPPIDGGAVLFGQPYSSSFDETPPHGPYYNSYGYPGHPCLSSPQNYEGGPPIGSAQGSRSSASRPARYSIYRVDPPVFPSPRTYFDGPPGRYNSVENTILPLASRFSPAHAQHSYSRPECLALLDTRTASMVCSHFPPPKCFVEGTEIFLISNAPNKKGLGMFAQTPLGTGEVILTEVPILIIPFDMSNFRSAPGASTVQDQCAKMFELLSKGAKWELIDLAWGGAYGDHGNDVNAYETIMRINPFAVSLPLSSAPSGLSVSGSNVSSIHRGIFLKTGRCNHSCGPNAHWTFDPSSLTLFLTCLRPIKTGDEITITYISPYLPFLARRAELNNLFGFDCSCDWCFRVLSQFQDNVQTLLIDEGDSARKFLSTFWDSYPSFEAWIKNPSTYPDDLLISVHKSALEMIDRGGLEVLSSVQHSQRQWYKRDSIQQPLPIPIPDIIRHTDGIALCYGVLSDVANFQKWLARALDARLSYFGPGLAVGAYWGAFEDIKRICGNGKSRQVNEDDDGDAHTNMKKVLEGWIAQPETFPAWGFRATVLNVN